MENSNNIWEYDPTNKSHILCKHKVISYFEGIIFKPYSKNENHKCTKFTIQI